MSTILREVARRLQAAIDAPHEELPFGMIRVRSYDVGVALEALKRYGGRRDWTPTPANLARLPGPVRRHVIALMEENDTLRARLAQRREGR